MKVSPSPPAQGCQLVPPPKTWLARLRREADISQDALAHAAGLSRRTLTRLENGDIPRPPLGYLVDCAAALGLDDWTVLVERDWVATDVQFGAAYDVQPASAKR